MRVQICTSCKKPFNPLTKKYGYIFQCNECGLKTEEENRTERYVGKNFGGKQLGHIEIFRKNTDYWRRHLKRENMAGFNANLPLNSPKFIPGGRNDNS